MTKMKLWGVLLCSIATMFIVLTDLPAFGYDITDQFSIGGVLAGAYQYQAAENDENLGRGALPLQPELSFRPTDNDEILVKFGFAAGNGLNDTTEFNLAPWAADLEDDVKDINGRNRDYLLTAWYKHTFQFNESHTLGVTGGLIDSTDYIDENAFANDEYTQFMNAALVNAPNGFYPSYDVGGAVEWAISGFSATGVVMNIGENDDGNNYNFFAVQIEHTLETSLGEGNYRLIVDGTSEDFLDKNGNKENRLAAFLSFDQELGEIFGAWIRFGWQDDEALINYDYLLSGGLNITGKWYGREDDNTGIGYAYLDGGNSDIDSSQVAEAYVRFALNQYLALTLDVQYMRDKYDTDIDGPKGFIGGVRMTAEF